MISVMIAAGDALGVFDAMAGSGATSPVELSGRIGLAVRPLREWMLGMAAADLLDYEDGVFELPAQAIPVLVDSETSPFYAAGSFATMPPDFVQPTIDLLRTGSGAGYGSMSSHELEAMERITGPAFRTTLPNAVIPATGIDARSVATIADVGCGTGVSSSVLAACFPNASVLGVDPSEKAQEVAGERGRRKRRFRVPARRGASRAGFVRPRGGVRLPPRHAQTRPRSVGDQASLESRRRPHREGTAIDR
jgi:SAM-dependent methyltransferase